MFDVLVDFKLCVMVLPNAIAINHPWLFKLKFSKSKNPVLQEHQPCSKVFYGHVRLYTIERLPGSRVLLGSSGRLACP